MLNRTLKLTDLTLFGVASIMGSGGFNLIGEGVRHGGSLWPVALGISAVLLMGSAYSYAGAFSRFKTNTAESDMVRSVFGPWGEGVGSAAILTYNLVSVVVILVFCSKMILPTSSWCSQVTLTISMLASMAGLALLGIDLNKGLIDILTWLLIGILAIGSVMGLLSFNELKSRVTESGGFMTSLWLFFFVLVGFDAIMKFAEETKDERDIPMAFYLSNTVSIVMTVGIALAISVLVPNMSVSKEKNAIGWLFAAFVGNWVVEPFKWLVLVFLLLTTFVVFLATTRYLYGLSDSFKEVNANKAPWISIMSVFGLGSVVSLLNNTERLVMITDLGFAVIAALVAGSVAVADWRDGDTLGTTINGSTGLGFLGLLASAAV